MRLRWVPGLVSAVVALLVAVSTAEPQETSAAATAAPTAAEPMPDVSTTDGTPDRLGVAVFAAAYLGQGDGSSVLVGVEVRGLTIGAPPGGRRQLDLRYELSGDPLAAADRVVTVPLDPVSSPDPVVRVLRRFALAPGRHQLRVTANERAGRRTGTVLHSLEVPQLAVAGTGLGMSGLVLASSGARGFTEAEESEEHRQLPILLQPPTAQRRFSQTERLEVHVEIYDWQPDFDFDGGIGVVTRVRAAGGTVVYSSEDLGASETLTNGRYGYAHSALVPIGSLAPGAYILEVEARSLTDGATAARAIPFAVVAEVARP